MSYLYERMFRVYPCGSSDVNVPPPPPPPPIQIPPEVAEKRDVIKPQGMFDPVTRKYLFRRGGAKAFKISSAQEQQSKTSTTS